MAKDKKLVEAITSMEEDSQSVDPCGKKNHLYILYQCQRLHCQTCRICYLENIQKELDQRF